MSEKPEVIKLEKMYTDYPHSDSGVVYFIVKNVISRKQINKHVKDYASEDGNSIFGEYYKPPINSAYDCTGRWFSSGIKLLSYDENYKTAIVALYFGQDV